MATQAQIDAALALYRQHLAALHGISRIRDNHVRSRSPALLVIADLNLQTAQQRALLRAARQAVVDLMNEP